MIPHFENNPSFISLVIATVGTTIAPWMIFLTQNNVVDKGVTPDELPLERIDAIGGAIVACAVAGFIIITTGTVLYPQGIVVDSAAAAATALTPIAGQYATVLFGHRPRRRELPRRVCRPARCLQCHLRGVRLGARCGPRLE